MSVWSDVSVRVNVGEPRVVKVREVLLFLSSVFSSSESHSARRSKPWFTMDNS